MENNVLKIVLWGMTVGRLYWNKEHRRSYFTYDRDFLTKGLDIAPLTASINSPLSQRGLPHAGNTDKLYAGLPEFIADSLPDHWGDTIFRQWASAHNIPMRQLTPVDRLAFIGKRSMGALEFEPAYENDNKPFAVDLESLNAPAYVNRHSMTIGGKNDAITKTDLLRFARMNDIKDAESIIADVAQAIGKFPEYARNCGIEEKWSEQVSRLILCDSEH